MEDARITDLIAEFRKSDGMLSNRRLGELGFGEAEIAEAESLGFVSSTGEGPWDTVFLIVPEPAAVPRPR